MPDYIENVSIRIKTDASNALAAIDLVTQAFDKIKDINIDLGKNITLKNVDKEKLQKFSETFKNLQKEAEKIGSKININFDTFKNSKNQDKFSEQIKPISSNIKELGSNINTDNFEKLSDIFMNLESNVKSLGENINLSFDEAGNSVEQLGYKIRKYLSSALSETISLTKAFGVSVGSLFQKTLGYDSLLGLINHYTRTVQGKEWFRKSNIRRKTSNTRTNIITDNIGNLNETITNRYLENIYGKGYVGSPNGLQIYYSDRDLSSRNNINKLQYNKDIFNEHNYMPGTKRWKYATYEYPFDEEDLARVNDFQNSLNKIIYSFETITKSVAEKLVPVLSSLLSKFAALVEKSELLRNILTAGLIINTFSKLISMVNNLNKTLAITKSLMFFISNPLATLGLAATGAAAYGGYKLFKNKKAKQYFFNPELQQNLLNAISSKDNNLSLYLGTKNIIANNNSLERSGEWHKSSNESSFRNDVNYNINTIQINSNARNIEDLARDITRSVPNNNTFLMNNSNFGGIY